MAAAASVCYGQFTASVQGIVQDQSGAVVPKAAVTLVNAATQVTASTITNRSGDFRFVSLAPGKYQVKVQAPGFANTTVNLTLETDQNLNVPVSMTVATQSQSVSVTSEVPLLNTAETRNQMTLGTQTLSELPLAGRNMISLATLAPGAVWLGTTGAGSPGSGVDNYSTETQ
ncbi:MAG: carboxypeptidase-like regulatory domain-containing protein, partial [Bryobacteraceae bacterium]